MSSEQKVARVYLRVSTDGQDLARQRVLVEQAKQAGYYIGGTYAEKESGTRADRPELNRMLADLQEGDTVIAERLDRLTRLPLAEAEALIDAIKAKGAKLAVPGLIDLSDLAATADGMARIVLDATQNMLLKIMLQQCRDDYEVRRERQAQGIALAKATAPAKYAGRKPDADKHKAIKAHLAAGLNPSEVARLVGCSRGTVYAVQREAGHV